MKFKLVEYPYGREIGFKQDIVWFIQGTDDNKTWNNYVWRNSPAIVYEKESYHCPPISAYLTIEEANEFLKTYIPKFNKKFSVEPKNKKSSFMELPKYVNLDYLLSVKYTRTVDVSNCISHKGITFVIDTKEILHKIARNICTY